MWICRKEYKLDANLPHTFLKFSKKIDILGLNHILITNQIDPNIVPAKNLRKFHSSVALVTVVILVKIDQLIKNKI